jgi:hypothetical protein
MAGGQSYTKAVHHSTVRAVPARVQESVTAGCPTPVPAEANYPLVYGAELVSPAVACGATFWPVLGHLSLPRPENTRASVARVRPHHCAPSQRRVRSTGGAWGVRQVCPRWAQASRG